MAVERGLEPLADLIMAREKEDPLELALPFVSRERSVEDAPAALAGARDIIAERITQDRDVRSLVRGHYMDKGVFRSRVIKGKEEAGSRYRSWFDWSERVSKAPSHRVLAMRRGEKELFLNLTVEVDETAVFSLIKRVFPPGDGPCGEQVAIAMEDGFKRLLGPQMETEVRLWSKERLTGTPYRSSQSTSGSFSWRLPWGRRPFSPLIRASGPAARQSASTARESCWSTR